MQICMADNQSFKLHVYATLLTQMSPEQACVTRAPSNASTSYLAVTICMPDAGLMKIPVPCKWLNEQHHSQSSHRHLEELPVPPFRLVMHQLEAWPVVHSSHHISTAAVEGTHATR